MLVVGVGPVKRSRFSNRERKRILREGRDSAKIKEVCVRYGISIRTFYRWQTMAIRHEASEKARLRSLEGENRRLKEKIAELSLDYHSLRAALVKDVRTEC
jgi:putative transposase